MLTTKASLIMQATLQLMSKGLREACHKLSELILLFDFHGGNAQVQW